jgi:hypothetical protein
VSLGEPSVNLSLLGLRPRGSHPLPVAQPIPVEALRLVLPLKVSAINMELSGNVCDIGAHGDDSSFPAPDRIGHLEAAHLLR